MSITSISQLYATYSELTSYLNIPANAPNTNATVWKPPQWNGLPSDQNQLFKQKTSIQTSDGTKCYFFDAVMHVDHNSEMRITEHPVQTGSNISDHAFQMPAKVSFEIGMSDAMTDLGPTSWLGQGGNTRSISAYRTLLGIMQQRIVLNINTRLFQYNNMLIESIHAPDDYKTQFGGRFTVNFKQIITATVTTTVDSSRAAINQLNNGTTLTTTTTGTVNGVSGVTTSAVTAN